jgi:hypothetical protein
MIGGGAGTPTVIYQTAKTNAFDNVTVLPNGQIAVPEITNPDQTLVQAVYPGTPAPTTLTTQVTLVDPILRTKISAAPFPSYARPSSVTVSQGTLFPPYTGIATDFAGAGGLYLISQ